MLSMDVLLFEGKRKIKKQTNKHKLQTVQLKGFRERSRNSTRITVRSCIKDGSITFETVDEIR